MAQIVSISLNELKRQTSLIFEGQTINVMLCNLGGSGYNEDSTVEEWEAQELSGDGYLRYTELVGESSYNPDTGREEVPEIFASFTADGGLLNYDTVVIFFSGESNLHSIVREDPNVIIADGQTQTYTIKLTQNN